MNTYVTLTKMHDMLRQYIHSQAAPKSYPVVDYSPFLREVWLRSNGKVQVRPEIYDYAKETPSPMKYVGHYDTLPQGFITLPILCSIPRWMSVEAYFKDCEIATIGELYPSRVLAVRQRDSMLPILPATGRRSGYYAVKSEEHSELLTAILNLRTKNDSAPYIFKLDEYPERLGVPASVLSQLSASFLEKKLGIRVVGDIVAQYRRVDKIVPVPGAEEFYVSPDESLESRLEDGLSQRPLETIPIIYESPTGLIGLGYKAGYSEYGICYKYSNYGYSIHYTEIKPECIPQIVNSTTAMIDTCGNIHLNSISPKILQRSCIIKGHYFQVDGEELDGYAEWTPRLARKYYTPKLYMLHSSRTDAADAVYSLNTPLIAKAKSVRSSSLKYRPAGHNYTDGEMAAYNSAMMEVEQGKKSMYHIKSLDDTWAQYENLGWMLVLLPGYTERQLAQISSIQNLIGKELPTTAFQIICNRLFVKSGYETLGGCLEHLHEFGPKSRGLLGAIARVAIGANMTKIKAELMLTL